MSGRVSCFWGELFSLHMKGDGFCLMRSVPFLLSNSGVCLVWWRSECIDNCLVNELSVSLHQITGWRLCCSLCWNFILGMVLVVLAVSCQVSLMEPALCSCACQLPISLAYKICSVSGSMFYVGREMGVVFLPSLMCGERERRIDCVLWVCLTSITCVLSPVPFCHKLLTYPYAIPCHMSLQAFAVGNVFPIVG